MRFPLSCFALTLGCLYSASAVCWESTPFYAFNQNPLIQIFGLPSLGDARVIAPGRTEVQLTFETANHFSEGTNVNEELLFDGETHRTTFIWRYGLKPNIEAGLELPYVSHGAGFLDHFIEDWHDFFGLSQGGRDTSAANRFHFLYRRLGVDEINLSQRRAGLGDARLTGAYQWRRGDDTGHDIVLRGLVKLPTGDAPGLLGSGAADTALWVSARCGETVCRGNWRWHAGGGLLWLGAGDVLLTQQRRAVLFGGAGAAWQALPGIVLQAELNGHGPFYSESALKQLNATGAQLLLGATWQLSQYSALDIAVSEDIAVTTAPDVSILIRWRLTR